MEQADNKSISSLVFGILSIFLPLVGLMFEIMGIVMSYKSVRQKADSRII